MTQKTHDRGSMEEKETPPPKSRFWHSSGRAIFVIREKERTLDQQKGETPPQRGKRPLLLKKNTRVLWSAREKREDKKKRAFFIIYTGKKHSREQ